MKILLYCLIIINVTLVGLQLGLSHFRATDGNQVAEIETSSRQLATLNHQLKSQIDNLSSLNRIHQAAQALELTASPVTSFSPPAVAKLP